MSSSPNDRGEGNQSTPNSADPPTSASSKELGEPRHNKTVGNKIWAGIGKASLALTTLWVLISIWGWAFPKGPHLEAKCEIVNKATPPIDDELDAQISALMGSKTFNDVEKILDNDKVFSGPLAEVKADALTNQLRKAVVLPEVDFLLRTRKMDRLSLLACRVTNTGDQPAHQTILDLPFKPTFATMNNGVIPVGKLSRSISIGAVRPNVPVSLRLWSDFPIFETFGAVRLSDQTGTGKTDFGLLTYGMTEKAARLSNAFGEAPIFFAFALLFIVSFAFLLIRMLRAIKSGQRSTEKTQGERPPV